MRLPQLPLAPHHESTFAVQVKNGTAKKGGAGGKFTWGKVLADDSGGGPQALDKDDPNYDSGEDAVMREAALSTDGDDSGAEMERGQSRIVQAVAQLKADVRFPSD
jgi:hypothetical protein